MLLKCHYVRSQTAYKTISGRYKMAKPHELVMDGVIEDRK
jgi:hypothetical protein